MTDIISMAREACDTDKVDAWHNGFWTVTQEELERFAELVAAHERDACATIIQRAGLPSIADAIRARGKE